MTGYTQFFTNSNLEALMINPFAAIANANAYVNEQKIFVIQKLCDAARCTLVVEKLEDIPLLLSALIEQIRKEPGARYCVKNHWENRSKDNIQRGYAGLHIKIRLKVPGDGEGFAITEAQIHHNAFMNGKVTCPKEYTHRAAYKPNNKQDISSTSIHHSREIFLSAMAIALNSQQRQKEVEDTLNKMEKNQNTLNSYGSKFIDAYQAVQPDSCEATISDWLKAVEKVNEVLKKSGLPETFEGASNPNDMRNTATTIDELFCDAQKVVWDFGRICGVAIREAQTKRPTAVYSTTMGPLGETVKSDHSLRRKVEDQLKEKLKNNGRLINFIATTKDQRKQKTAKHISLASVLILAGVGMQHFYSSLQSTSAIFDIFKKGFQNTNDLFHNSVNNFTNDSLTFLQNRFSFQNLSLDNPNNTTDTVNSLTKQVIACNLELYEQIKASSSYIETVTGLCNEQKIRSASQELSKLSDAAEKQF